MSGKCGLCPLANFLYTDSKIFFYTNLSEARLFSSKIAAPRGRSFRNTNLFVARLLLPAGGTTTTSEDGSSSRFISQEELVCVSLAEVCQWRTRGGSPSCPVQSGEEGFEALVGSRPRPLLFV